MAVPEALGPGKHELEIERQDEREADHGADAEEADKG